MTFGFNHDTTLRSQRMGDIAVIAYVDVNRVSHDITKATARKERSSPLYARVEKTTPPEPA